MEGDSQDGAGEVFQRKKSKIAKYYDWLPPKSQA